MCHLLAPKPHRAIKDLCVWVCVCEGLVTASIKLKKYFLFKSLPILSEGLLLFTFISKLTVKYYYSYKEYIVTFKINFILHFF